VNNAFDQWKFTNRKRFPSGFVESRLQKEHGKDALLTKQEAGGIRRLFVPRHLIQSALKYSGLKGMGAKHAADIHSQNNTLSVAHLPGNFEGYRILQISDPHFNGPNARSNALFKSIQNSDCDLCVLTGDYRYRSFGPWDDAIAGLTKIREKISCDIVAILGNHDSIQMVPAMESIGITVLLNESYVVNRDGSEITFVGVDDPSYYKFDDIDFALRERPLKPQSTSILLAHSPDLYHIGSLANFSAYLCGHTHGGQICLPGSIPIMMSKKLPRYLNSGQWHYNGTSGYTSVGSGVSVVNARFFCPPEITTHTLTQNKQNKGDGGI